MYRLFEEPQVAVASISAVYIPSTRDISGISIGGRKCFAGGKYRTYTPSIA